MIALPVLEEIIDRAGVAPRIELLLPIGVRARQLLVRTLLLGMLLVLADRRPAFLTEVHHALVSLPEADQRRLISWPDGRPARTCSPTGRPSAPSAWPPAPWPRTSPTGCRPRSSRGSATTCWKHPSRMSSRTPAPRWPSTGPTWKPFPPPVPRHQRLRRPRGLLGTPLRRRPRPGQRAVLRLLRLGRHHDARGTRPGRPSWPAG